MTTQQLMTRLETAKRIRAHPQTLVKWEAQGRGPRSFKIGRRRFYDARDVDEWIVEQKLASA